jgi:hypothetical protein
MPRLVIDVTQKGYPKTERTANLRDAILEIRDYWEIYFFLTKIK